MTELQAFIAPKSILQMLHLFFLKKSLHSGRLILITLCETQELLHILVGKKCLIGLPPPSSFLLNNLTPLLFFTASLAPVPLLTFPLLPPLLPFPSGKRFRMWVPITFQFSAVPLSSLSRHTERHFSIKF